MATKCPKNGEWCLKPKCGTTSAICHPEILEPKEPEKGSTEEDGENWYCVDCKAPLILKRNCVVKDESELRCHDCYIKYSESTEEFYKNWALKCVKWRIGKIISAKFLEYNDGKFNSAIELNPAIHAAGEFCEQYASKKTASLEEQLKAADEVIRLSVMSGVKSKEYFQSLEKYQSLRLKKT